MRQTLAEQEVYATSQGEGAPRLFLHCSLGRHQALMPLAQRLPPARNIFFDLPGHGRSGAWHGDEYQTDAMRIAECLLEGPAHVIGHSFGGTVALRLAVERPDLVSRLTLIEPVMFAAVLDADAKARHDKAMEPFIAAWSVGDLAGTSKAFMDMWGDGPAWEDIPAPMKNRIESQIHLIPAAAPAIEDDVHVVIARLSRLTCPVDLIEGSASPPVMSVIMDGLQAHLPQAKRHVIAEAGHMVPMSHVAQVAAAML